MESLTGLRGYRDEWWMEWKEFIVAKCLCIYLQLDFFGNIIIKVYIFYEKDYEKYLFFEIKYVKLKDFM